MASTPIEVVLIVAGGSGLRMGADYPKQFIPLAGKPIIVRTIEQFWKYSPNLVVAVVIPHTAQAQWDEIARQFFSEAQRKLILCCFGGVTRMDSVKNGLQLLSKKVVSPKNVFVAIHDAVRPFIAPSLLQKAFEKAKKSGNATVCVPVKSSIRLKTESGSKAVERSQYFHVQTPQIFALDILLTHYENVTQTGFTDDASLAEHAGMNIHLCNGSYENIKITTPEDLLMAEELARKYF